MTCPRCGHTTEPGSGACVACGTLLPRVVAAVGVATPIPSDELPTGAGLPPVEPATDPGQFADEDVTGLGAPAPRTEDVTRVGVPPPPAGDATRLGVPPTADDATRLGVPPPADDATRLGALPPDAQDVTRLGPAAADPEVTQMPSARPTDADATYAGTGAPLRPPSRSGSRTGMRPGTRPGTRPGSRGGQTGFGELATDLVGQDLGERYHIIKLLGAGGMGAVYQAWDAELGVAVALKTVRPEVAADPLTARMLEQRFKQELLLARKVTHKNIVRVHDIGEVDGLKYITMPFLDGEDLSTILKREGKLAVPRVMIIARSVASGLGAAHLAGVVHRDLKPANIMVDADGEGLVMDFGIARSTSGPPAGGAAGTFPAGAVRAATAAQTMVGSVVGTVEYMAPEQARAEAVDQRADIYAFGLILYDLLLGRVRAEKTDSVIAELQKRMQESPPAPRTIDPTIPAALDKLIVRCIQTDAAKRFATTQDLIAELNKLDAKGVPLPLVRRLTWKMSAAAAVLVAGLVGRPTGPRRDRRRRWNTSRCRS